MFVVYLDLELKGRSKPVPCKQVKPVELLGDGFFKLVGVEQIRELARPTMTVTELIVKRCHIDYIIGGDDPSDLDGMIAPEPKPIDEIEDNQDEDEDKDIEPGESTDQNRRDLGLVKPKTKIGRPKGKIGRPKGSKNKKTTEDKK